MSKAVLWQNGHYFKFFCPGCEESHSIPVKGANAWGFNGDLERPTITPSILSNFELYGPDKLSGLKYEGPYPAEIRTPGVCHCFIRDGRIEFLSDCTHALAGQTVDLPEFET